MRNLVLKFFIVCLFLAPFSLQAYQLYSSVGADVNISVKPENPGPFQDVVINIQSYNLDLNHCRISWYKDSKLLASNSGLKNFSFRTGAIGSQSVINLVINPSYGDKQVKMAIVFSPLEIELLWQADTFVPYWYKGKAKPSSEAKITVSAITRIKDSTGKEVPPESLIYEWKKDGKILNNESGVGKNILTFTGNKKGGVNKVNVMISNSNKSLKGEASTEIFINEPQIVFYEEKPLIGIAKQTALMKKFSLNNQMILKAVPFFFSDKNLLNFSWKINNTKVLNDENDPSKLLLKVVDKNVSSRIDLQVSHPNKLLQSGKNDLIISSQN